MHHQNCISLAVVLIVSVILSFGSETSARPQVSSLQRSNNAASGGASVGVEANSGSSVASGSANVQDIGGSGQGGSVSFDSSASAAGSSDSSHGSASVTSKPEGILGKVKDIFMGERKDDKKISSDNSSSPISGGSSLGIDSGSGSSNQSSLFSSERQSSSQNLSSTTPRPEGFLEKVTDKLSEKVNKITDKVADKVADVAKKSKEVVKDVTEPLREDSRKDSSASRNDGGTKNGEIKEQPGEKKDDATIKKDDSSSRKDESSTKKDSEAEKKDDMSVKKDDSSSRKEDSVMKKDLTSERKDESALKKEDSSSRKDESNMKKDSGEKKEDMSLKKDESSSRKDDMKKDATSDKKEDSSSRKDELKKDSGAERKEDVSMKKDDSTSRKDDSSLKKDQGSERKEQGAGRKEGLVDKATKVLTRGSEVVNETVHKIDDKAHEINDKVRSVGEDLKNQTLNSNAQMNSESRSNSSYQSRGSEKERNSTETRLKPAENGDKGEDRSAFRNVQEDEKSLAVDVFDRAHNISKIPVETVLKPIDKLLGVEKDPLISLYDNSHELLKKPLEIVTKPVESILTGAFKTAEEEKKESDKLLSRSSETEKMRSRLEEERVRNDSRSVFGIIADKTVELMEKPIEIILKPFDRVLGTEKDGKKNPLLRLIDEIYGMSKKPMDTIAKPFEKILKKMVDGDQLYQISFRINSDGSDPKLITRLYDGALNIADRVITKPLEMFMKPIDQALGISNRNSIIEATHSLKNATRMGVELFTRPIDRMIKEIADIGDHRISEADHEDEFNRQKEEASRFVMAFDKIHEVAQYPFEIILRPVGKMFGSHKEGHREPFLRAWDIIHQILRTPIQIVSKPVEDALLGERKHQKHHFKNEPRRFRENHDRKNHFIDGMKKVEKIVVRPIEIITSPVRKLILGEESRGSSRSSLDKNSKGQNEKEDKIVTTLEKLNDLLWKPLEVITQPFSDTFFSEDKDQNTNEKGTNFSVRSTEAPLQFRTHSPSNSTTPFQARKS